jgi:hypothetical protein
MIAPARAVLPQQDQAPTDPDKCHILCVQCNGMNPPFGSQVRAWCGAWSLFDYWAPEDASECVKCAEFDACPVCGFKGL